MLKRLSLVVLGCVSTTLAVYFTKKYFAGKYCSSTTQLDGKTVIVTGANSGIGREVALELARRGACVVLACRDLTQAEELYWHIIHKTGNQSVQYLHLDLNSFESIRKFADSFKQFNCELYALVNNAGVFYHPQSLTVDGFDVTFQTNYLGPFLLTHLLLDTLKRSRSSRIVNVSSEAHKLPKFFDVPDASRFERISKYNHFAAYGSSKLCLMLFTHKLAQILYSTQVTVNAVNPGNVETNVYRHFPFLANPVLFAIQKPLRLLVVKTPWEGAQSVLHAVLAPELENISGKYISFEGVAENCVRQSSELSAFFLGEFHGICRIGDCDTNVGRAFERCLQSMYPEEVSSVILYVPKDCDDYDAGTSPVGTIRCEIKLGGTANDRPIFERGWEEKYESALANKARGVGLFNEGSVVAAFLRFNCAVRLLISTEEDEERVSELTATLFNNMASCHLKRGNFGHVVTLCTKVLVVQPGNVKAFFRRGVARTELAEYNEAKVDLEQVLLLEPGNAAVVAKLAQLKLKVMETNTNYANVVKKMFETHC